MFSCSDVLKACDTTSSNKIEAQKVSGGYGGYNQATQQQPNYAQPYYAQPPTLQQPQPHYNPTVQQQVVQSAYAEEKANSAGLGDIDPTYALDPSEFNNNAQSMNLAVSTFEPQTDMYGNAYGNMQAAEFVAKPPPEPKELGPGPNPPTYALEPIQEPPDAPVEFKAPPEIKAPPPKGPDLKEPEPEETVEYNDAYEWRKAVMYDSLVMLLIVGVLSFVFVQKAGFDNPTCLDDDELKAAGEEAYKVCDPCGSGTIVIPLGGEWELALSKVLRAILYFFGLGWCFLGIAVVCDQFMEAIEMVTSKERVVWVKVHGDTKHKFHKRVWNDTVANLTLMALGSSAPEILLSVIELVGNSFFAGELGPSTIVGSAAFNLLVITAVCVSAIPAPDTRKIDGLSVFGVTASLSVFAYVWLIVILKWSSADVVSKEEALLTFLFFPMLVIVAFIADKGYCGRGRAGGSEHAEVEKERDRLEKLHGKTISFETVKMMIDECKAPPLPKMTKAQYRKEIMKKLMGGGKEAGVPMVTVGFVQAKHMCLECAGTLELSVRLSARLDVPLEVKYFTQDGLALAGKRYEHVQGSLVFSPGTTEQTIKVPIIDNEVWEEQEDFSVCLDGVNPEMSPVHGSVGYGFRTTRVVILNDDEPGTLVFAVDEVKASRESEVVRIFVNRINGSTGGITVKYQTIDDSAFAGSNYTSVEGSLSFADGNCKEEFSVMVKPFLQNAKDKSFRIKLTDPSEGVRFDPDRDGGAESAICEVILPGSGSKRQFCAACFAFDCRFMSSLSDWKEQFLSAIYCNGSAAEQSTSSTGDWIFHLLSFFWKIIFAFIPPAKIAGGWACFCCALGMIGAVTMIVGDMASLMGCCMTVPDDITAVTIVALGTSLPDTFASKSAAQHDPNADNSIGNVTGSNCVNVFLGLGLPWTIGAFYWESVGKTSDWIKRDFKGDNYEEKWGTVCPNGCFLVPAGKLSFSVIVFTSCACICIALLLVRRGLYGGELGGPAYASKRDSIFLVCLWLFYIVMSILNSKGVVSLE
jgi:solute carrier family 8 (sodium/calcium exchanger)